MQGSAAFESTTFLGWRRVADNGVVTACIAVTRACRALGSGTGWAMMMAPTQ